MLFACFICLLTSRFLEILGMERISNGFFTLGTVDLGLMIAYVVGRYTGNYPEFITFVDHYAEVVWLFVSIIFVRCFLQSTGCAGGSEVVDKEGTVAVVVAPLSTAPGTADGSGKPSTTPTLKNRRKTVEHP